MASRLRSLYNGYKKGLGVFKRSSARQQIGSDHLGNTYWVVARKSYDTKLLGRLIIPASGEEDDYEPDNIPKLWAAWLRGTREDPPTEEDLQNEVNRQIVMEYRIGEVEEKERKLRIAEGREPLIEESRQKVGGLYQNHAALPEYTTPEPSTLPSTGAASSYRPGSWNPTMSVNEVAEAMGTLSGTETDGGRPSQDKKKKHDSDFSPSSWTPGS